MVERRRQGPKGSKRVIRGGSWNEIARNVRAAARNWNHPENRNDNLGFRLARAQPWAGGPTPDPTLAPSARVNGWRKAPDRRCASRAAEAAANAHRRVVPCETSHA